MYFATSSLTGSMGCGGIFISSMNLLVLSSSVLERPWREGRMYWQCFSLCLCLPWVLCFLYSSLHVLTPFFTLVFGKLSGLSCAILSSLFSQATCVVLTLLSCEGFLLFLFGVFFIFFSTPHFCFCLFFPFSAFIFECCAKGKLLILGKCNQNLHV